MDFHQTDGHNHGSFASMCHLTFSIPRRLTHKRSNTRQTYISHNILPTNSSEPRNSRIHSKFKEVRFDTSSVIQRNGISDTAEYSQGTTRSHRITTSDYQTIFNSDSSYSMNFSLLAKLIVAADLVLLGSFIYNHYKYVSYLSRDLIFYLWIIKVR